jgi:hypothetical protein
LTVEEGLGPRVTGFLEETEMYLYLFEAKVKSSSQSSYLRVNQDDDYSLP